MHIGLIDIDGGNFPNLCLMKLSTHYKRQGHTIYMLTICIALLKSIEDGDMCVENIQDGDIAILLYYLRKLDEIDTLVRGVQ